MKKILSFILLMAVATGVNAATLNDLLVEEQNKSANSAYVLPGDADLINIHYVGTATGAVVTIASDAFSTAAPYGTADLSITMSAAAYDTLGEFCDYINADADYECKLTGGKRDDDTSLLIDVTGDAGGSTGNTAVAGGYDVEIDTAGDVTADNTYINRLGITPESGKRVILKYCDVQSDEVGTLRVYGKLRKYDSANDGVTRNDTTLVASMATVSDTAEVDGNIYNGYWMEFSEDAHVVISVGNAATAQTSSSYINCFWDEK